MSLLVLTLKDNVREDWARIIINDVVCRIRVVSAKGNQVRVLFDSDPDKVRIQREMAKILKTPDEKLQ